MHSRSLPIEQGSKSRRLVSQLKKKKNICGQRLKPSQSLWPRGFHAQLAYQQHTNSRLALTHSRIHVPLLQTLQVRRQRRRRKLIHAHLHQVKYIYVTRQSNQMHVQPWFFFFFQITMVSSITYTYRGPWTSNSWLFQLFTPQFLPTFHGFGKAKSFSKMKRNSLPAFAMPRFKCENS